MPTAVESVAGPGSPFLISAPRGAAGVRRVAVGLLDWNPEVKTWEFGGGLLQLNDICGEKRQKRHLPAASGMFVC